MYYKEGFCGLQCASQEVRERLPHGQFAYGKWWPIDSGWRSNRHVLNPPPPPRPCAKPPPARQPPRPRANPPPAARLSNLRVTEPTPFFPVNKAPAISACQEDWTVPNPRTAWPRPLTSGDGSFEAAVTELQNRSISAGSCAATQRCAPPNCDLPVYLLLLHTALRIDRRVAGEVRFSIAGLGGELAIKKWGEGGGGGSGQGLKLAGIRGTVWKVWG